MNKVTVNLIVEVDGKPFKASSGFTTTGLSNRQLLNEVQYNTLKMVADMLNQGVKIETFMIPNPESIRDANET